MGELAGLASAFAFQFDRDERCILYQDVELFTRRNKNITAITTGGFGKKKKDAN